MRISLESHFKWFVQDPSNICIEPFSVTKTQVHQTRTPKYGDPFVLLYFAHACNVKLSHPYQNHRPTPKCHTITQWTRCQMNSQSAVTKTKLDPCFCNLVSSQNHGSTQKLCNNSFLLNSLLLRVHHRWLFIPLLALSKVQSTGYLCHLWSEMIWIST